MRVALGGSKGQCRSVPWLQEREKSLNDQYVSSAGGLWAPFSNGVCWSRRWKLNIFRSLGPVAGISRPVCFG